MKYFINGLLLLVWLLLTVILTLSIVGILFAAVILDENADSYWFELGKKLLSNISC
jgi:uncharacterized membrane protein